MFSKQLLVGLLVGILGASLVFLLFSGDGAVSSEENVNDYLLAQVAPNTSKKSNSSEKIIEVRDAPAVVASSKNVIQKTVSSSEEKNSKNDKPVVKLCVYETSNTAEQQAIISEVAWMGTGDDANAEWVEVQNKSGGELDVSGWQLVDKAQQIRAVVPAAITLPRNGFLLFERDKSHLQGESVIYKGALSNTNEGLRLFDSACQLQDEVIADPNWPAGTNKPKQTAERAKDLSWHTFYGEEEAGVLGTPGRKNSDGPPAKAEEVIVAKEPVAAEKEASSSLNQASTSEEAPPPIIILSGQVIISEVMAGTASAAGDEFIELWNTTDTEIDLTGFSIKKKVLSSGSESSLVTTVNFAGKKIGAGERFLIGHGSFAGQSQMTWPNSYSIAYSGNAVILINAQGTAIDEVGWTVDIKGKSYTCESQGGCAVSEVLTPGS